MVQKLVDARANYRENLHRLVEFYQKHGDTQRQDWAERELKEFAEIRQGDYLPDVRANLVVVELENATESDTVEAMLGYRKAYRKTLTSLIKVLEEAKDGTRWAQANRELKGLIAVNKYVYLRDADTPGPELRPTKNIAAADALYEQAMELKKNSRGLGVRRYETQLSMETFRRLISQYPSSDKIEDAAFQIAELCRDNLRDYQRAVRWYECVVAWDPDTHLRANYCIAEIYDKHLVNRLTALDYYRRALQIEARGTSMRERIQERIDRLRGK